MSNYDKTSSVGVSRLSGVFNPVFAGVYEKDSAILCSGKFYICVRDTVWLDEINEDWNEYTGKFIYQYKGVVDRLSDLPTTAINGAAVYVSGEGKTYAFNGQVWDPVGPTINLSDYVLRSEIDEIIQENIDVSIDGTGFVKTEVLAEMLTEYIKESKLNDILKDYAKITALDNYAAKTEVATALEAYATKHELQEKIDSIDVTEQLSEYAKTSEVETKLVNYVKTDKLDDIALKTELLDYTHKETTEALDVRTKNIQSKDNSLFFVNDGFELDLVRQVWRKPTFDTTRTEGYSKGDVIWLLPPDYGTLWTPPSTEVTYPWVMPAEHPYNLLGKSKTYQAQTSLKLYAIRLMSIKDNNTDNPSTDKSCIGSSWVVDEPNAVIESGISANSCKYKLFANGESVNYRETAPLTRVLLGRAHGSFSLAIRNVANGCTFASSSTSPNGVGDWARTSYIVTSNQLSYIDIISTSTYDTADIYMIVCSFTSNGYWYQ